MPHSLLGRGSDRNAKGFILNPVPNQFELTIEFPYETKQVSQDVQDKMAHLARTSLVNSGGMYGFITVTRLPPAGTTEYEDRLGVSDNWYVGLLRKFVRGAFWENYLTEEHIQKLGGVESIKSNAPCARVDELIPGRALALRLTEDINDVTAADLEKLEAYFRPLAPTQDKVLQR